MTVESRTPVHCPVIAERILNKTLWTGEKPLNAFLRKLHDMPSDQIISGWEYIWEILELIQEKKMLKSVPKHVTRVD